jgi:hypothetical protein
MSAAAAVPTKPSASTAPPPTKFCVALVKETAPPGDGDEPLPSAYESVRARQEEIVAGVRSLHSASRELMAREHDGTLDDIGDAVLSNAKTRLIVCVNPFSAVDAINAATTTTRCELAAVALSFDQEWKAERFARLWGSLSRGVEPRSASGCALSEERACEFYIDPAVVFGTVAVEAGEAPVATAMSS